MSRTELTVADGMAPPDDLPRGECITTRLDDGRIRIDRADPRVLISGELLDIVARDGDSSRTAWLDTAGCAPPPWRATYVGAVLHISGVNQRVTYRITDYLPRVHAYIGEWPD